MDGTIMMGYELYKSLLGGRPAEHLNQEERIKLEALSIELNAATRRIREFRKLAREYLDSDEFGQDHPS